MIGAIGGILGAGASIAGALIGADAQREATQTNWAIALMNHYARERERWETKMEARRQEGKQDLGTTDALGNTTKFVPGVGWVQELSPEQSALQERIYAEQMRQLGPQAMRRERAEQANEIMRIQERDRANALFDQMRSRNMPSAEVLENLMYGAATKDINRAFDDTTAIASRQAMRTKTSNAGEMFRKIAKERGKALSDAAVTAKSQSIPMATTLRNEDDKVRANLYNMFATRASALPGTNPSVPTLNPGADVAGMARMSAGNDNRLKAAMMEGGRLPFIPPNYGTANAVGAAGTALQGLLRNLGGSKLSYDEWDEDMKNSRHEGNEGEF